MKDYKVKGVICDKHYKVTVTQLLVALEGTEN